MEETMKKTKENKLLQMFDDLMSNKISCMDFSYDFPIEMLDIEDDELSDLLDDMPELCAFYSPYKDDSDDSEIMNDKEFKEKIKPIYFHLKKYCDQPKKEN